MDRYAMCPECGRRLRRARDVFGDWDGETYICDYCSGNEYDDYDEEDDENYGERMSVDDAALAWLSRGMDEDYTFEYTEEELKNAL